MAYTKQTWDTTSYVNPTRMNHIEDGISNAMTSSNMGYLGAKNLNFTPYYFDSREISGITWTVNADGTVKANGTATAQSTFVCHSRAYSTNALILPNGDYIMSGCPSGGASNKYYTAAGRTSGGAYVAIGNEYGNGRAITLNGDDYSDTEVRLHVALVIANGQTVNNLVFKPMIRLAGDNDNTYYPYAMTNQDLTKKITNIKQLLSQDNIPTTATSYACDWAKYSLLNITLGTYNNVTSQITVPTSYFEGTGTGNRVLIYIVPTPTSNPPYYEIYKNDNENVYIVGHNVNSIHKIKIYGIL